MELTAFSSSAGHWEFTSLSFGLKTVSAIFQHIVNTVLSGLIGSTAQVYLDDIIVLGNSFSNHVDNLTSVLERLQEAHLTVKKIEKCEFFKAEVNYLGHVITPDGLRPQSSKLEAIKNVPEPKTVNELQSFLGLSNYYRKFIAFYSQIIAPLLKIMGKRKGPPKKKDITPLVWTEEAKTAVITIKKRL